MNITALYPDSQYFLQVRQIVTAPELTLGMPSLLLFALHGQMYLSQAEAVIQCINAFHELHPLRPVLYLIEEVLLDIGSIRDVSQNDSRLLVADAFPVNLLQHTQCRLCNLNRVRSRHGQDPRLPVGILRKVLPEAVARYEDRYS